MTWRSLFYTGLVIASLCLLNLVIGIIADVSTLQVVYSGVLVIVNLVLACYTHKKMVGESKFTDLSK